MAVAENVPDWTSFVQKSGYPMVDEPGALVHVRPEVEYEIHALLSYDERGYVQGALMYFPSGTPFDPVGGVTVLVRPNRRRRGVGRLLLMTALTLWPDIDLDDQEYTAEGRLLADAIIAKPLGGTA